MNHNLPGKQGVLILSFAGILLGTAAVSAQQKLNPKQMKPLGLVDERFVSYNVEAVEVTGGRFWAPFSSFKAQAPNVRAGFGGNSDQSDPRFQYRAPIDLSSPRLRNLASALSPAYVRVSGTWRNSTFFQDNDEAALKTPPAGFQNVLTRAQWKGVVDFSKAVGGEIVASVSTSAGTRDAKGVWTTTQARSWLDYTKAIGGHIAMTEFMNEPTLMNLGGVNPGYGAEEYARDSKIFDEFIRKESPSTVYLGPSSAAEGLPQSTPIPGLRLLPTETIMKAMGPLYDGFSYHVYYTRSQRCAGGTDVNTVLSPEWFNLGLAVNSFYTALRDKYLPGKDIWLTETGEASCGGDTWASQFVDSFRLLDQFGMLAQHGVKSIMYNTLASSDYGMLDETTLTPRPNYWAAVLWKRTMGTRALDTAVPQTSDVRLYAQCMKAVPGGVSVLVMNVSKTDAHTIEVPVAGTRYTLSSADLLSNKVSLNGHELTVAADGAVPPFQGQKIQKGTLTFAPLTITVLTLPTSSNPSCTK